MKKFLLILLLSIPAMASEPKFHFREKVSVVAGFYTGCKGKVSSLEYPAQGDSKGENRYVLNGTCRGGDFSDTFKESELAHYEGNEIAY